MAQLHTLPTRNATFPKPNGACENCTAKSLTICASLEAEEQMKLSALATSISLNAHQTIFQEGDTADYVYNITSGSVSLSKAMPDGRRQITDFMGPGDFLGLNTRNTYTVSAEALTESWVCRFPRGAFQKLLTNSTVLEHRMLTMAENELAAAQEQILLLGRKTAMERIASFLQLQAKRSKMRGLPGNPISLPMTRAEVADYLGLTIETVSRCFTKLRKLDIIGLPAADRVEIKQPDRLKLLAEAG